MSRNYTSDARRDLSRLYENKEFVLDKSGCRMVELIGYQFIADQETIFGEVDRNYVRRELDWYNSQSLNINDMEASIPTIWKLVANEKGEVNSNYGWCIYSQENGRQYFNVLEELKRNQFSRRAVMIYNRPSIWKDYNEDGKNDFICTSDAQYLIRENEVHSKIHDRKLVVVVNMRSNDAVYGYKNDLQWQLHVQINLHSYLQETYPDLRLGSIVWNTGSLHVYERHFQLIEEYLNKKYERKSQI